MLGIQPDPFPSRNNPVQKLSFLSTKELKKIERKDTKKQHKLTYEQL